MPQARGPKRILVALDTGSLSRAAIETAARLAIGLSAELEALFVEDVNLRRLAELPFAKELGTTSAQPRRFDIAELDRAIGVQAQQVRRALEAAARKLPLRWSLEVVRGDLIGLVVQRAATADLLVLGRTRRPAYRGAHGEKVMRRLERRVARHPVVALFDGSAAAARVLDAALALERRANGDLLVAIPASRPEQFTALSGQVDAMLAARGHASSGHACLPDAGIASIAETAKRRRAGAVLLPVADLALAEHEFEGLVDEIACPVVLIR
jgi:nucleotide-binding universal stress UspA family protein